MKSKCLKFIEKKSINYLKNASKDKKKYNSLLNIFPQDLFVKVL
jgi:hypothetical protein